MARSVAIIGLEGIPLVKRGDDLAGLIIRAAERQGVQIREGDILVVGQKVVSKSEGRIVEVTRVNASERAVALARRYEREAGLIESILREARELIKVWGKCFVVRNRRGMVCLNSGLDKSNVKGEHSYTMLPENPDFSAGNLRARIKELTGKSIGVIISDTYSRPFRRGMVDLAIGVSGIRVFKDYRGRRDLYGRRLLFKFVALVDEIAAAAELVIGQGGEGIPVAVVRGLSGLLSDDFMSSADLLIEKEEDMYSGVV